MHRTVRANQIQVSLSHDNRSIRRYVIDYVVLINARRKRKFNEHSSGTRAIYAFDQTLSRSIRLEQELSVDETIVKYKGQCKGKVCIPKKPIRL